MIIIYICHRYIKHIDKKEALKTDDILHKTTFCSSKRVCLSLCSCVLCTVDYIYLLVFISVRVNLSFVMSCILDTQLKLAKLIYPSDTVTRVILTLLIYPPDTVTRVKLECQMGI